MFKHSNNIEEKDKSALILTADVGGSHITTGIVQAQIHLQELTLIKKTVHTQPIHANSGNAALILADFVTAFKASLVHLNGKRLAGIAIAMPGPFLYAEGIFKIKGLNKYGALYGLDFKQFLYDRLDLDPKMPIFFKNDADCFGQGAYNRYGENSNNGQGHNNHRLIAITLGTGFGSAFIEDGQIVDHATDENHQVPEEGNLFNQPLVIDRQKMANLAVDPASDWAQNGQAQDKSLLSYSYAEDLISSRGLLRYANEKLGHTNGTRFVDVALMASEARKQDVVAENSTAAVCKETFELFGLGLGTCLQPWLHSFEAQTLVIGGGIANASDLFLPALQLAVADSHLLQIHFVEDAQMAELPLIGAASALLASAAFKEQQPGLNHNHKITDSWRTTHQPVLPRTVTEVLATVASTSVTNTAENNGSYQIYPWTPLGDQKIQAGFESLAGWIKGQVINNKESVIALDGYVGVDWAALQAGLGKALIEAGIQPVWLNMTAFTKAPDEIEKMVAPFLGEATSVWGTKTTLSLSDFFDSNALEAHLTQEELTEIGGDVTIVLGTGAGLVAVDTNLNTKANAHVPLIFVELPKNEIQYRMRAGVADNLYTCQRPVYAQMYKRAYFVDWPVLNAYRESLGASITIVADAQWTDTVHWMQFQDLQKGFAAMTSSPIRARPWFAPGAWGGDWMKRHIPQLDQQEVNYAWSFELIVPENGLIVESDGWLLEIPFDWLMSEQYKNILGRDSERFGSYFPIRFDFLDTFNGGNLSIQCHPSNRYIQENFGENITQDETYYMLDTADDAGVYIGFQGDIDPAGFKQALLQSQQDNKPLEIEKYVQLHPAQKHELYLIPNQTIHSAGKGSLVLEISATPYIFTFKLYDWVRPDLNGKPRPINIEHGYHNLDFSRKGAQVEKELISKPVLLASGDALQRWHLPTHPEHFYDIHRLDIVAGPSVSKPASTIENTNDQCHIMMVVEGEGVEVVLDNGNRFSYKYAETFIIPAAVRQYQLMNTSNRAIKVVKAFVK